MKPSVGKRRRRPIRSKHMAAKGKKTAPKKASTTKAKGKKK